MTGVSGNFSLTGVVIYSTFVRWVKMCIRFSFFFFYQQVIHENEAGLLYFSYLKQSLERVWYTEL